MTIDIKGLSTGFSTRGTSSGDIRNTYTPEGEKNMKIQIAIAEQLERIADLHEAQETERKRLAGEDVIGVLET